MANSTYDPSITGPRFTFTNDIERQYEMGLYSTAPRENLIAFNTILNVKGNGIVMLQPGENYHNIGRDNVVVKEKMRIKGFKQIQRSGNIVAAELNRAFLVPNRYDPHRAHVAVYNSRGARQVPLDVSQYLKDGESFSLLHHRDIYGPPLLRLSSQVPLLVGAP